MRIRFIYLILILIGLISGCATPEKPYKPITLERSTEYPPQPSELSDSTANKLRTEIPIESPNFAKEARPKPLPPMEFIDPKQLTMTTSPVMINVEKMPLSDFIIYALGETLKVAFVMDEALMSNKTPITMSMPQPLAADKTLEIVLKLFEKYNLSLEEKAGALYVFSKPPAPKEPFDVRVGRESANSPADILQVVPLKFIRPQEIEPLIKELYKTGIQIKPYPRENVLLLYGKAFQIQQVMNFIDMFDLPMLSGKVLILHHLIFWQPEDFIKQLSAILEGLGISVAKYSKDPGILFIPIKQLNSVLIVAPDEKSAKYVLDWKSRLDTAEASGTDQKLYTYFPKYSKASELVLSIKRLYLGEGAGQTQTAQTVAQRQSTAPQAPQPPAQSGQTVVQQGLKMAADDGKNIIMTMCSPAVYKNILDLINNLDIPPKQVLIEATIAELSLTGSLQYGVEWYLKNIQQGGGYTLSTLGRLGLASSGLTYQFIGSTENLRLMIQAFAGESRGRILSTPRLMVLDNKEATIQVGQDVPVVVQDVSGIASSTTENNTNVVRSYQYRSTGIILKVKPTVNTEGLLTLEISQEVSANQPGSSGDNPIILMRKINTSVVIGNGQTLALGGLMKEDNGESVTKVPILGDIPILGNLFKTTNKTKDKTELLILVTPTILVNTDEGAKITEVLRKELKWFK
jgi:general secretion pathway protein D